MDRRQVVEVLGIRAGSGLLLADRLVLTAAHLLVPPDVQAVEQPHGAVVVRPAEGGDRYAARCVWFRYEGADRGLDAALLEITSPGWSPVTGAAVRLGWLAGSAEARVHAFGFPDATTLAGVVELSPVTGVVHTDSGARSGRPEIVLGGEPERGPGGASLWAGLSGGPVFAAPGGVTGEILLGIIVGDPAEFASRRLRMIPAPAVLADPAAAAVIERHCGTLTVVSFPEPGQPAQPTVRGVRCSLPPDTAAFTGRVEELDHIATTADAAGVGGVVWVAAIGGMPGVGKTALAVHVAYELSGRFPDRQLFIDLRLRARRQRPMVPLDALADLLAAVGVDPRFMPDSLDKRAEMWREQTVGQRVLLVLDNATSSVQVTPLLPGGGNCLVLVTSRRHLGDLPGAVTPVLLGVLSAEQAEEMFTRLAPRAAADPAGVAEVVRLAGCLPLAISLLARVFARHQSWELSDLAAETRGSLLTLKAEHRSIAAAFGVSYRHLAPARRRFFDLLGLHPGTAIDSYAAAALAGISPGQAGRLLDALHGEGLLTEIGHRRYGMHDLLRRYADEHAASLGTGRDQGLSRVLDYYQHAASTAAAYLARQTRPLPAAGDAPAVQIPDLGDTARAVAWMRAERANLLACIAGTSDRRRIVGLSASLAELLRLDGPWNEAVAVHTTAARAAERLGDRLGQATALNDLGDMLRLTDDCPGAAQVLQQAIGFYRDLGSLLGQANALSNIGAVRQDTADYHGAIQAFREALDMHQELGDQLGQAHDLHSLGSVLRTAGDFAGAEQVLLQALDLYRSLGNQRGEATALAYLGLVLRMTGGLPRAAQASQDALELFRILGDRLGQAYSLINLGIVRQVNGDLPGAARAHQDAIELCHDIGGRVTEANALVYLGVVRRQSGDFSAARQALQDALNIYRVVGDRSGEAEVLNETGTLHRATGHLDHAKNCHEQALGLARQLNSPWDEAHALAGLGRCARAVGNNSEAATRLLQARAIFQQLGAPEAAEVSAELDALS